MPYRVREKQWYDAILASRGFKVSAFVVLAMAVFALLPKIWVTDKSAIAHDMSDSTVGGAQESVASPDSPGYYIDGLPMVSVLGNTDMVIIKQEGREIEPFSATRNSTIEVVPADASGGVLYLCPMQKQEGKDRDAGGFQGNVFGHIGMYSFTTSQAIQELRLKRGKVSLKSVPPGTYTIKDANVPKNVYLVEVY